jgi:hypothetical protein
LARIYLRETNVNDNFSKIIAVDHRKISAVNPIENITVFPNPVNETFTLLHEGQNSDIIHLKLYDNTSRIVYSASYLVESDYFLKTFERQMSIVEGVYNLFIYNESKKSTNSKKLIFR